MLELPHLKMLNFQPMDGKVNERTLLTPPASEIRERTRSEAKVCKSSYIAVYAPERSTRPTLRAESIGSDKLRIFAFKMTNYAIQYV
jgi:hypothetical protein